MPPSQLDAQLADLELDAAPPPPSQHPLQRASAAVTDAQACVSTHTTFMLAGMERHPCWCAAIALEYAIAKVVGIVDHGRLDLVCRQLSRRQMRRHCSCCGMWRRRRP